MYFSLFAEDSGIQRLWNAQTKTSDHALKFSKSISWVTFTTESLSIRFLDTSSMLSQKDRQMKLAFRKAQQIQLLLFSHGPTTLLAKVKS